MMTFRTKEEFCGTLGLGSSKNHNTLLTFPLLKIDITQKEYIYLCGAH